MFLSCVLLLCLLLRVCGGTLDPDREMCYSRQHRDAAVNTHVALDQKGAVMEARAKPSEKDCILTCCSEDVAPGLKCNLVVYRPPKRLGDLNCQLFHCPSERECPLMTAGAGVNTYNIFKGITHPTTRGRITAKPTAAQLTTTTTPTTPMTTPTTTPTTPITTPTTTTTPTTPTTTPTSTATSTTPAPTTSTSSSSSSTEEAPTESESPMILETVTMTTAPATTATSTTQSSTTTTTTKSTSTKAPRPPPRTSLKPSRPKKPSKPSRPETPPVKPVRATPIPTTPERPPAAVIQLGSDPTRRAFTRGRPVLSLPGKPKVSRVMWKNSLVAIVVITLIFLTLILSLAARKAMESFDRRHYTRLELNDLHYEV